MSVGLRTAGRHRGGHGPFPLGAQGCGIPLFPIPALLLPRPPVLCPRGGDALLHPYGITDLGRSCPALRVSYWVLSPSRSQAGMSWGGGHRPFGCWGAGLCWAPPRERCETLLRSLRTLRHGVGSLGRSSKWSWKLRLIPQRVLSRAGPHPAESPSPCRPSRPEDPPHPSRDFHCLQRPPPATGTVFALVVLR